MIKIGLVGLPNVGKSSLFSFLTKKDWDEIKNYPFATIAPNFGIITLVDPRLERLSRHWKSQKTTPSVIEIVDIAGLVKGASQGYGLGNEFLSHIREVDMTWHVIRCFPQEEVIHVENSINPIRDYETIQLELILADLQQTQRLAKLKTHDEKTWKEKNILQLVQENLEKGILVGQLVLSKEEKEVIKGYNFLTSKPIFLVANYSGKEEEIKELREYAKKKELSFFPLAVKKEIEELSRKEDEEVGLQSVDFSFLAEKIKELLKLKTFFTVGEDETRSWLAKKEMKAKECAGLIHSDISKGFIRAHIYKYQDWLTYPNEQQLKKMGKIRTESAQYIIQEGDICHFLFK